MEPTPWGRVAARVMSKLRHMRAIYGAEKVMSHVDHADFRDELRAPIERELLQAKLEGLRVPVRSREKAIREIVAELAKPEIPEN
jgi:hypothetical protein